MSILSKENARKELQKLIDQYSEGKRHWDEQSESDIGFHFIEPLFEKVLGWERLDITKEERVFKKRADYILRVENQGTLVVEAKKTTVSLTDEEGRQAVSYAYHKKIKFAVVTNFKNLTVYHALSNIKNISKNQLKIGNSYFRLNFTELIEKFDTLWLLSKESFEKGEINKLLSAKDERLYKPIDKHILEDLIQIRKWLSTELKSKKTYLDDKKIDEIVQTLIDKLIFIRSVEDRGLENKNYLKIVEAEVRNQDIKLQLFPYLIEKFKYFNERYDSKLFEPGLLEKEGVFSNEVLRKVILALYSGTSGEQEDYQFDKIPGDLFGNIYEQYLGTILQNTEKRVKLDSDTGKRKKMGIFYTPTYIVDYIVKNTVGNYIKNKPIDEILEIRVIDPSCGSGSFLTSAFKEICNRIEELLINNNKSKKYQSFNTYKDRLTLSQKVTILTNCIYGADLDEKAIELARLNLLLKLLEDEDKNSLAHKLPQLVNLKCGNSLIDDTSISDHALKWEVQFSEVFRNGGFDIVIGNPPYVKARGLEMDKEREFIQNCGKFVTPYKMWDLYIPFVEKGLQILNEKGKLGMIIPDTIGISDYTSKLVKLIIDKYNLYQIDFFPDIKVFESATVSNKIIFVAKEKTNSCKQVFHTERIDKISNELTVENIDDQTFKVETSKMNINLSNTLQLKDCFYVSYGARFNSDKSDPKKFRKEDLLSEKIDKIHCKTYTEGKYLDRYIIKKNLFVEWNTERCPHRLVRPTFEELYPPKKLLLSRQKRIAAISLNGEICDNTIIVAVPFHELKEVDNAGIRKYLANVGIKKEILIENSKKFNLNYILGIINSKLISYFLHFKSTGKIDTYPDDWKIVPIKDVSAKKQEVISSLVDRMLVLQKKFYGGDLSGNEKERLEQQINNIDYEIDQEVYRLYDITKEEQKIIEESLK